MKMVLTPCLAIALSCASLNAEVFHHQMEKLIEEEWVEEKTEPFTELMISWNAQRPSFGTYKIYARVKTTDWSPWLPYAVWGSDGQSSFFSQVPDASVRIFQDTLEIKSGAPATGFQIKVEAQGNARVCDLYGLHVYINRNVPSPSTPIDSTLSPICLNVRGLSQMQLKHSRADSLCSPTSTTAAISYLLQSDSINPVAFAEQVRDRQFDIFGNWTLNVAAASSWLGSDWQCWVERLSGFSDLYERLAQNIPVVVSIKGPLAGGALPYQSGHLIVVIGCNLQKGLVFCMDPAFASDDKTLVSYSLKDFMQAWERRNRLAYIFSKNKS